MSKQELVITGIATAELMEKIRAAHVDGDSDQIKTILSGIDFDRATAALIETLGTSIFLNNNLATAEEKLNYACSVAGLVVSVTGELMKQMVEARYDGQKAS